MSKYIVIPNIKIHNANAQPTWWIVSAPAMTSYVGFAHALALSMKIKCHEGIAVIHHDIQFLGEQISNEYGEIDFLPHQFRSSGLIDKADYPAGSMSLSSQPTARCHLNISLIIAIPDDAKVIPSLIETFLRGARLAGGSIIQHGEIKFDATNQSEALKAVKKNGYSIIERKDLMETHKDDRDVIDTFLRSTRRYHQTSKNQDNEELNPNTWTVPTCLGYVGISSTKERSKVRNGLPHLYVEPLVGLIQYKSTRNAGLHFWRYSNPQPNVFLITTN